MYIEDKSTGLTGPARIGRVSFSKTGQTLSRLPEVTVLAGAAGPTTGTFTRSTKRGLDSMGQNVAAPSQSVSANAPTM